MRTIEAEVAVLGGGAGGCSAAFAATEAGKTVVVLEEGRRWRPAEFKQNNLFAFRHLYAERGVRSAVGNGWFPVNGGRGLGGSTLINSAISFKTPEPILADWRERAGFDPDGDFGQLLDRTWKMLGVVKNPERVQGRNNLVFKRGVEALGWSGGEFLDRSAPGCSGCGVCQLGCPSGGKWSADRSFLALAESTGRCVAHTGCRLEGVRTEGGRVVAAFGSILDPETDAPVDRFEVRARQFVVSMGSIESPRFLLRNGLADSANCGQHLHFHPASGVSALFDEEIVHWHGVSQGYYVNRWEEGFLLQTATVSPDAHFLSLPLELGPEVLELMSKLRRVAMAGAMVHDEDSVGTVRESAITFTFGEIDRKRLLAGVRATCRVYFAAGASAVYPAIMGVGRIDDPAQIDAKIPDDIPFRRVLAVSSHPMGSNRMARDAAGGVVDGRGRVFGWDNLYIADASVFPSSLGVNPQVTVMSVGQMVGRNAAHALR